MDYEKKYKEALERARERYEKVPDSVLGINIVGIFPELRESEDEMIRKLLICGMNALKEQKNETFATIPIDDAIAWLEKQKDMNVLIQEASEKAYTEGMRVERKHWIEKKGENILIEEIKRRKELYSQEKEKAVSSTEKLSLGGRIAMLEELCAFIGEKQGKQKSNRDKLETFVKEWRDKYSYPDDIDKIIGFAESVIKWYQQSEQKPAWSKDDEFVVKELGGILYNAYGISDDERETCTNWLKSIEGRVQPQPRQWSEEDEKERKRVIGLLEGWLSTFKETCYAEDCKCSIDWLKSLRIRLGGK